MTIKELLQQETLRLKNNNVEFPHQAAEILLSTILKKDKVFLLTYPNKSISKQKEILFKKLIQKRITGWSVAVIIGYKYFYNLKFIVNKNVLVPRPETEIIVDEVLKQKDFDILIDLGTGSSCIITSIYKNLNKALQNKISFYGLDISNKALNISKKNSVLHKIKKINFVKSDLMEYFLKNKELLKDKNIIITANLPYLTLQQIKNSPSIHREPVLALESGPDGLKHYRRLFKELKKLSPLFQSCLIYCEIDGSQTKNFKSIVKKNYSQAKLRVIQDLSKNDRIISIQI